MSQDIILSGNLDMLHSLYDFKATYEGTLDFKSNEYFLLYQTNTKHKNWWEVINEKGEIGFIPSNYVENLTVSPTFYQQFIDKASENLKSSDTALDYLKKMRQQIQPYQNNTDIIGDISPPLPFKNSDKSPSSSQSSLITDLVHQTPEIPEKSEDVLRTELRDLKSVSPSINHQSVFELVENVRINTQLSHEMSRMAVATVVEGLHELLPASVFPYLSTILSHVQSGLVDNVQIDQTHDASRLKIIFTDLTTRKEDSQQRSWTVHEDEGIIKDNLTELISILSNADASISRHVISSDQYHFIITLIQYYQMEIRWPIRQLLLQTFGVLCSLDKTVVNIMLNSILPGELARDMMANTRNVPKLNYSSILLTMIFSMGESMPITHHDILNETFVLFLLDNVENPPDTDVDEQIPDLFLNCVISFNLQFEDCGENFVLNALENKELAKVFTEKILLLLNREYDPVRIFEHLPAPPHSVLKLFIDLLSRKTTANLFYTNDIKVLIDIIVRNISDLSPGDCRRLQYIELCRRVMRNTNYEEHRHRIDEILKCFTRIFCEESESSRNDQKIVREISHEFPQYFK